MFSEGFLKSRIGLLLALLLFLMGCTPSERPTVKWSSKNGKLKVLTTIAMIHDLVQEVGGEHVDSIPLIRGGLDPHSYELVKGDDEKFAAADLIFYNGLGLEHGLSLRQNLERNPKAYAVGNAILEKNPSSILIVNGQFDPHIWMDISLWMGTVDPIVQALSLKDPQHAGSYLERGEALKQKMQQADQQAYEKLHKIAPQSRYLVTSHDAFNYFTRRYLADPQESDWRLRCQAPEGLAPEAELSVTDLIAIMTHIEQFHISVLFPESNVSKDSLKKILQAAKEKGFHVRLCQEPLYGDSMGEAPTYLDMVGHNVTVIARELGEKR